MISIKQFMVATCLTSAVSVAQAGFVDSFVETLPGGWSPYPDAGFIGNQLNGMHDIIENGRTGIFLPFYTNHPSWDYDNRYEQNAFPGGAGLVRTIIDERGNERMVYAMLFRDSNYEPEPIFGYAWVARFPIAQTGLHVGAGYTAAITFRNDMMWLPIPVPLPLVSAGTDKFNVYMTYIPVSNVFFFFSKFEFDDKARRMAPLPEGTPWRNNTEIYAQGSWVKTDLSDGDGDYRQDYTFRSAEGFKIGLRHFFYRHWALDLSYQESDHDLRLSGHRKGSFELSNVNLMLQYHFEVLDNTRLHVGAGAAYSVLNSEEYDYRDSTVNVVLQTGFTWAVTDHLRVMGDVTVNFPHFHDVPLDADTRIGDRFTPANTSFNLGLGYAF